MRKYQKYDIDSHGTFLNYLIRDVRNGLLVPVAFQRPYVWTKAHVLDLVASIIEGLPVGAFLLWTPGEAANLADLARPRLGPIKGKDDVSSRSISLLLDGQNRLATLAWLMRKLDDPLPTDLSGVEAETWGTGERLVLDFNERSIVFVPEEEVNVGFRLPMSALFHGQLNWEMRIRETTQFAGYTMAQIDDASDWLDEVRHAFSEARIVVTNMKNVSVEQAKTAFLRISRAGVPMSEADFNAALDYVHSIE